VVDGFARLFAARLCGDREQVGLERAVALAMIESLFQALPSMSETTPPASVTSRLPAATCIADVQNRT
jgi:hypothetical protein